MRVSEGNNGVPAESYRSDCTGSIVFGRSGQSTNGHLLFLSLFKLKEGATD
jgi:hypothetical protein